MRYDVIGDIHGHVEPLKKLLTKLGYKNKNSSWAKTGSIAVFLGDYIDRGPHQLETIDIIRRMVDNGDALALMGNHEFNAIAWFMENPLNPGEFLRPHKSVKYGDKKHKQHEAFLHAVGNDRRKHYEIIAWFLTLPLWIDLHNIRFVHATWHPGYMDYISEILGDRNTILPEMMVAATSEPADEGRKDSPEPTVFKAIEAILKGLESPVPGGVEYRDKDGHPRSRIRLRWWDPSARDYRSSSVNRDRNLLSTIPEAPLPDHLILDLDDNVPVFFGHYWMTGDPSLLAPDKTCLDYSVAKGGKLTAYRWDGETRLKEDNLVWVESRPEPRK